VEGGYDFSVKLVVNFESSRGTIFTWYRATNFAQKDHVFAAQNDHGFTVIKTHGFAVRFSQENTEDRGTKTQRFYSIKSLRKKPLPWFQSFLH
jgi:hypothetical protein